MEILSAIQKEDPNLDPRGAARRLPRGKAQRRWGSDHAAELCRYLADWISDFFSISDNALMDASRFNAKLRLVTLS